MYEVRVVSLDDVEVRLRLPQNLGCEKAGRNSAGQEGAINTCQPQPFSANGEEGHRLNDWTLFAFQVGELRARGSKYGHLCQEKEFGDILVLTSVRRLCKRHVDERCVVM